MASISRTESSTGFYHVMNRGDGKQILFEDDCDYKYFLKRIKCINETVHFELCSYCLMDNHFHLLIYADLSDLSTFMHKLSTSYAKYYNRKYEHYGHVFQGRYNCKPIDSIHYLEACIRYIHNNPVEANLCSREKYPWSSYNDYVFHNGITNTERILDVLGGIDSFRSICESNDDMYLDCVLYGTLSENKMLIHGKELLKTKYGINVGETNSIRSLPKAHRNLIIKDLKTIGLSRKTIEHLTGISKSIIDRA